MALFSSNGPLPFPRYDSGISIRKNTTIIAGNQGCCHNDGFKGHAGRAILGFLFGNTGCCDGGYGYGGYGYGGYGYDSCGYGGFPMAQFWSNPTWGNLCSALGGYRNSFLGSLADRFLYGKPGSTTTTTTTTTTPATPSTTLTQSSTGGADGSHKCEDKDASIISGLTAKLKDLSSNPTLDKFNELYTQLKDRIDKGPEDKVEEANNKATYENLMATLKKQAENAGFKLKTDGSGFEQNAAPAAQEDQADQAALEEPPASANPNNPASAIPKSIDEFNSLDENGKQQAIDNMFADPSARQTLVQWLKDGSITGDAAIYAKSKFYNSGYSNVAKSELEGKTPDQLKQLFQEALEDIIDKSGKTKDIKNFTVNDVKKNGDKYEITITTKGGQNITYCEVEEKDGELLFHGFNQDQIYVLQKEGEKYHLMQYDYHDGFGTKDVD